MKPSIAVVALTVAASFMGGLGCGQAEQKYQPLPAYSGDKRPSLPNVPTLPKKAKTEADAYTVWGATHDLNSIVHDEDFKDKDVTIVGYIVATNYDVACADPNKAGPGERCVPTCAVRPPGGKGTPEGCEPQEPSFWLGDEKDSDIKSAIRVMGWATNPSQLYGLLEEIDKAPDDKKDQVEFMDNVIGRSMPVPAPAKGAKVKVTGAYDFNYSGIKGKTSDPLNGIMTFKSWTVLDKAPEPATLPGMKRK